MRIPHNFVNLTGNKYGRWTVKEQDGVDKDGSTMWLCKCDCGTIKTVSGHNLKRGRSSSCGCFKIDKITTHGCYRTPTYKIWEGMKSRCGNPNTKFYSCYGGRGITVCERWVNSFENFLSDMGDRPKGLWLDRIDNNLGYSKDNCKWSTPKEQANNRRCTHIEYNGKSLTVAELSKCLHISASALHKRIRVGWSMDKIVNTGLMEIKTGGRKCHS